MLLIFLEAHVLNSTEGQFIFDNKTISRKHLVAEVEAVGAKDCVHVPSLLRKARTDYFAGKLTLAVSSYPD